jgi:hypothetical protein
MLNKPPIIVPQISTRAYGAADLSPAAALALASAARPAHTPAMDTTLNYAIGFVLFIGAAALALAILIW